MGHGGWKWEREKVNLKVRRDEGKANKKLRGGMG